MALVISRIALLWVLLFYWHETVFSLDMHISEVRIITHISWILSTHFSVWLTTCLRIFYLLKIANFSSLLFRYLKLRVKSVLLILLLGSLPSLISQFIVANINETLMINKNKKNVTWNAKFMNIGQISYMIVVILTNLIPFLCPWHLSCC